METIYSLGILPIKEIVAKSNEIKREKMLDFFEMFEFGIDDTDIPEELKKVNLEQKPLEEMIIMAKKEIRKEIKENRESKLILP